MDSLGICTVLEGCRQLTKIAFNQLNMADSVFERMARQTTQLQVRLFLPGSDMTFYHYWYIYYCILIFILITDIYYCIIYPIKFIIYYCVLYHYRSLLSYIKYALLAATGILKSSLPVTNILINIIHQDYQ